LALGAWHVAKSAFFSKPESGGLPRQNSWKQFRCGKRASKLFHFGTFYEKLGISLQMLSISQYINYF